MKIFYGKEREEGSKERATWHILVPQKEDNTLPSHTVNVWRTRSNTGSLLTRIQAPTCVYIANTVHMEKVMNAIHLQLIDFLRASPPAPPFFTPLHNQRLLLIFHPRYAVLNTTEVSQSCLLRWLHSC